MSGDAQEGIGTSFDRLPIIIKLKIMRKIEVFEEQKYNTIQYNTKTNIIIVAMNGNKTMQLLLWFHDK